ncbi:MAG: type III secretion inner membrane ring lipoprotein SctJ [Pseudomonadota bacterium]
MTLKIFNRRTTAPLVLLCAMALAGCRADLYSGLTEKEANDMLAVLLAANISAEKVVIDDGVTLQVDEEDLLAALEVLNASGYPKKTHDTMGQVFAKSGVMSSPFEERVRFVYALGEEVSQTLSEIDGVLTARVHIVMPEDAELGQEVQPASASVFIKHEASNTPVVSQREITEFVANAIEGLAFDNVAVMMTAAQPSEPTLQVASVETETVLGVEVARGYADDAWLMVQAAGAVIGILALALLGAAVAVMRRGGSRSTSTEVEVAGE